MVDRLSFSVHIENKVLISDVRSLAAVSLNVIAMGKCGSLSEMKSQFSGSQN